MEIFVSLVIIVFGVLQIILFFKLWGMTNDVSEMKYIIKHYQNPICQTTKQEKQEKQENPSNHKKEYDIRLDSVKEGDKVEVIFDGREVSVMYVEKDRIFCKTSILGGGKYFLKKQLRYIGNGSH